VSRRHAVLLTLSNSSSPTWSYHHTGTLPRLISFVSHSYANTGGVWVFFPFWNSLDGRRGFDPGNQCLSKSSTDCWQLLTNHCLLTCPSSVWVIAALCFKSFSCNTYGSPRKCCKQKTYRLAKPFRCNTYKNSGCTPVPPSPRRSFGSSFSAGGGNARTQSSSLRIPCALGVSALSFSVSRLVCIRLSTVDRQPLPHYLLPLPSPASQCYHSEET
jgi:hypothetical protein